MANQSFPKRDSENHFRPVIVLALEFFVNAGEVADGGESEIVGSKVATVNCFLTVLTVRLQSGNTAHARTKFTGFTFSYPLHPVYPVYPCSLSLSHVMAADRFSYSASRVGPHKVG